MEKTLIVMTDLGPLEVVVSGDRMTMKDIGGDVKFNGNYRLTLLKLKNQVNARARRNGEMTISITGFSYAPPKGWDQVSA